MPLNTNRCRRSCKDAPFSLFGSKPSGRSVLIVWIASPATVFGYEGTLKIRGVVFCLRQRVARRAWNRSSKRLVNESVGPDTTSPPGGALQNRCGRPGSGDPVAGFRASWPASRAECRDEWVVIDYGDLAEATHVDADSRRAQGDPSTVDRFPRTWWAYGRARIRADRKDDAGKRSNGRLR